MSSKDFSDTIEQLSPYEEYLYASYVPTRGHNAFKRHTNIGHAKSAARGQLYGVPLTSRIYKFDKNTGQWNELPWRPGD